MAELEGIRPPVYELVATPRQRGVFSSKPAIEFQSATIANKKAPNNRLRITSIESTWSRGIVECSHKHTLAYWIYPLVTAIGLLNEKSLHSALKHWYARPGDLLEFPLDGYIVDILRGDHVIEIQTGNFSSIKRKMRDLSGRYRVSLIYPVAHERWILEVPGTVQGAIMRRKSPKRQAVNQLFEELVSFPDLLKCPNFSIEVVSIQEEQLRRYSRRWRGKRRTWRIVERRLLTVLERFVFDDPSDLWQLIPPTLPDPFETSHLASVLGHSRWFAQKIAYCLRQSGVVTAIGKTGNSLVYSRLTPPMAARL